MRHRSGTASLALVALFGLSSPAAAQQEPPPPHPTPTPPPAASEGAEETGPAPLLRPTVELNLMAAAEGDAWFGLSEEVLGAPVDSWNEGALEAGVDLTKHFGHGGTLTGRLSGQATWTRGGLDAAGSNFDDRTPEAVVVDDAWLGWRSRANPDGFELEAAAGRLEYQLGTGFLFWDGGYEGGDRGGFWMNAHDAWKLGAAARVKRGPFALRGAYLQPDDETTTRILGADVELGFGDAGLLGTSFHHFLESDALQTIDVPGRDGLGVFGLRAALTPFASERGLSLSGELAVQRNGDERHALAGYAEAGYELGKVRWTPRLYYRFVYLSGDDPDTAANEEWDPLFYAFNDWSLWYLGEVFGEYVQTNSNLVTHHAGLELQPSESTRAMLLYYHFRLDREASLSSRDLGDEVDLALEWAPWPFLELTALGGILVPGRGAEELTGGDRNWTHAMLYAKLAF